MRFIDREEELQALSEMEELSKQKFWIAAIIGPRRVGKTRLVLEFMRDRGLYFFVNKNKSSEALLSEFSELLRQKKITSELEEIKSWDSFFETLVRRYRGVAVFDEFQNFTFVDKSVFGILQKTFDLNEDRPLLMILTGSTTGLMKKLFRSRKEPLYGRIKRRLELRPLDFPSVLEMCRKLGFGRLEDAVALYSIFGGYPKYYVAIEDNGLQGKSLEEILEVFFFQKDAVLEDEVQVILHQEFGKRSGLYYSILEAVASGNNSISEIASYLRTGPTSITRQVNELINYFGILRLERPVVWGEKKGLLFINHPLLHFWFRFFYKNYSLYQRRDPSLEEAVKEQLNSFIGSRFEELCREFVVQRMVADSPLHFTRFGKQWGKIPGAEKGKNVFDVDIVALSEEGVMLLVETKWRDVGLGEARNILNELQQKAGYIQWPCKRRELGLIARRIEGKERLREEGYFAFDLRDLEKAVARQGAPRGTSAK
jgi:AAA+ ATPase superfamily predicted ATPase